MRGSSGIGDKQCLLHIANAITEIEEYTRNVSLEGFLGNSMMMFASVKQFEIIGEAANYLEAGTKNKFSDVEWKQIIGMRHILVHEYFGIDFNLIWQIINNDLPHLKSKIQQIINNLE